MYTSEMNARNDARDWREELGILCYSQVPVQPSTHCSDESREATKKK